MSTLLPTTTAVAWAWLRLAVPGVGVGDELPRADDDGFRTNGFVRTQPIGGNIDRDVPMRHPVVAAECWVPPGAGGAAAARDLAEQLAGRLVVACYDPALMGVLVQPAGDYSPAFVHTVIPLGDPEPVRGDPSDFERFDVDLLITWTGA